MNAYSADYGTWLNGLKPRTCLLMHWLADIGAVAEPGWDVRAKARRFAQKREFLGRLVEESDELNAKAEWLLENDEFEIYVTWLMWLRFMEYVPHRFILPQGHEKVLAWVRGRLGRPELTAQETRNELRWQANRLNEVLVSRDDDWLLN